MTASNRSVNGHVQFAHSSVQYLADLNQCQHISDECVKYLTLETSNRVRSLLQDALKFTQKSRRTKMLANDFQSAIQLRHVDPIVGSRLSNENLIFKSTSVANHREVQYIDDHEIQLDRVIASSLPQMPLDISIRTHWLAIDGEQPVVPENPDVVPKDDLTIDSLDPTKGLAKKRYNLESSKVKCSTAHELSLEQQVYYKEVTEACVGAEEQKRQEAISSLTTETGLQEILPRLVLFISEGVKVNLVQNNLAILIYLMRMINALLENKSLHCERYLHQLFPAIISCILSRQLCPRPEVDNHWALRDFAASRCAQIIKMFSTNVHGLRSRIVRIYLQTFHNEHLPLVTHYGALMGLCKMGQEAIEEFVFPLVRISGDRMMKVTEYSSFDKLTMEKIKNVIMECVPTAYHASHSSAGNPDHFNYQFGPFFGPRVYKLVSQLYQRTPSQPTQVSV